jgi:transcriptional regulator with XRE-family HTH domain
VKKFADYLEQQFLAWQKESGKRQTLNNFAEYLGVKRPLLSLWLNGSRRPGDENIDRLGELFGPEVYDALDEPRPDPKLHYISRHWGELPIEVQNKIAGEIEHYTSERAPIDEESPPEGKTSLLLILSIRKYILKPK